MKDGGRKGKEEKKRLTVSSPAEPHARRIRTRLEPDLGTDLLHHVGSAQELDIRVGRERVLGGLADVVRVEVRNGGDGVVDLVDADVVGVGASRVVARSHALVQGGLAARLEDVVQFGCDALVDQGAVRVAHGELDARALLDGRVEPAVVDADGLEREFLADGAPVIDGRVLGLDVVRELRAVVPAVALGEDAEVAALVLGEAGVEGLQQVPDVGRRRHRRVDGVVAEREAGADGLVHVEHVGVVVPAPRVQAGLGLIVVELAWAVFLEEPNH